MIKNYKVLLKKICKFFLDIFASNNNNFREMVNIIYSKDIGEFKLFKSCLYHKLHIEEQIISKG